MEDSTPRNEFRIEPKSISNTSEIAYKDELFKAGQPDPNIVVNNIKIDIGRTKSPVVARKEKMRVIDEILVISVPEVDRMKWKNSPSSGQATYRPKLTFSYPSNELT